MRLNRREFIEAAAAIGATLALAGPATASRSAWRERRDLYPEGVASGDPTQDGVILWTRRPFSTGESERLTVEIATDPDFRRVVATAPAIVSAASDWTCRVLVGGLRPATVYWYRFADAEGNGSRIGRTITAPADDDPRPVKFAFVSCQNVNEGAQNAWRRMIWEDERAPREEQLGFVLHLGDFIYEVVQYPEDIQTRYDRRIRDIGRVPGGVKVARIFHIPVDVEGYRAVYRMYLADPDIQDARARWPFVTMWDNHEFSWQGWQSQLKAPPLDRPAQTIKVAANQAWFEYQPARVVKASGPSLERFDPPSVSDAPLGPFDDQGLGQDPGNLAAIHSLKAYRALRYGRHLDLLITDQHSYRMGPEPDEADVYPLGSAAFPNFVPQEAMEILDAGRSWNGGDPPAEIVFGEVRVPNIRRDKAPVTILGAEQKAWFKQRLRESHATWKIWGNSMGMLDYRADPQNLPEGVGTTRWPGGYASFGNGDPSSAYVERAEIYDLVRSAGVTGFAIVSGDRHSFWAGYAAKALPPKAFEPVGLAFITGSISSPGMVEAFEHRFPRDHALRPLFMADRPGAAKPEPAVNMLLRHGVRSCLEYARSFDRERARALSNPGVSPHLSFVDMGGHGYATVRLSADEMRTEFVCIERPLERSETPDGGPLRYRLVHAAPLWRAGERPRLSQQVIEGDPGLGI